MRVTILVQSLLVNVFSSEPLPPRGPIGGPRRLERVAAPLQNPHAITGERPVRSCGASFPVLPSSYSRHARTSTAEHTRSRRTAARGVLPLIPVNCSTANLFYAQVDLADNQPQGHRTSPLCATTAACRSLSRLPPRWRCRCTRVRRIRIR